jgi:hypothetical protein
MDTNFCKNEPSTSAAASALNAPTGENAATIKPPPRELKLADLIATHNRILRANYAIPIAGNEREHFIRGIQAYAESLTSAAAHLIKAKASVHCGEWEAAKDQLEDGFSEFAVDSNRGEGVLKRLAQIKRMAKRQQPGGGK